MIAARAAGRLLLEHAIVAGDRVALVVDRAVGEHGGAELGAYADALAAALTEAGATVEQVDAAAVREVRGRGHVDGLVTDARALDCDVVAVAAVPSPAAEGPRQQGCAVALSAAAGGFAVTADVDGATAARGVFAAGDVCGYLGPVAATAAGARAGARAAAHAREAAP